MSQKQQSEHTREMIDACFDAQKHCQRTIEAALVSDAELGKPDVLRALLDCAAVASATAQLLSRNSRHARGIAMLNADVASSCARAIEPYEHFDGQLRATYAACLRMAEQCRSLGDDAPTEDESDRDKTVADSFPASDPPPPPSEI